MPAPYPPINIVLIALVSAVGGAIAASVLSMMVVGLSVDSDAPEGAALGILAIGFGVLVIVGPITFFVICMIGSRRSNNAMRNALPVIGLICFVPSALILLVLLNEIPGRRGLQWVVPIVMVIVLITMVGWLVEPFGKLSTQNATILSGIAAIALVVCFVGSTLYGETYRRDQRQAALSARFATMYVLPESSAASRLWETSEMWTADPVSSPHVLGSQSVRFANANGGEVQLKLETTSEQKYCDWLLTQGRICDVVVSTDSGRTIQYESGGGFLDVTIDGGHVPLRRSSNITIADIEVLVDGLEPVTVDEWLDELERWSD